MQLNFGKRPALSYLKIFREEDPADENYARYFAYTLRQTTAPKLEKGEVEELLRYGFCYPEEELKKKPFELRLNNHKTLSIIYFSLFELIPRHKPIWASKDYKTHFALFLKHNFRNFEGVVEGTIRNNIRGRRPKGMKRGFDLSKYLP